MYVFVLTVYRETGLYLATEQVDLECLCNHLFFIGDVAHICGRTFPKRLRFLVQSLALLPQTDQAHGGEGQALTAEDFEAAVATQPDSQQSQPTQK